ncbi:hypothetical protein Bca52824_091451 [Brassica carinata]|uniref:Uncharacterized protein n=1 Tax=Brassica carinata TaxID=52824 RepID=A0A8X7NXM8_BRACI|nr:hypothetical protein Bca52824_091451 [Brassica carinata]
MKKEVSECRLNSSSPLISPHAYQREASSSFLLSSLSIAPKGPVSLTHPPSDPPNSNLKVVFPSNLPDPPVPPNPPPDSLSFTDFLPLYDLIATVIFPHNFPDPKLCLMISYELVSLDPRFSEVYFHLCSNDFCNDMTFSPLVTAWNERSIVLKMVLFEAEAKECQVEEVFLFECPLSETTLSLLLV